MVCTCTSVPEVIGLHPNHIRTNHKENKHVSIWKWVQKYSTLTDRFVVGKRKIKKIFVDETLLKINGQNTSYG